MLLVDLKDYLKMAKHWKDLKAVQLLQLIATILCITVPNVYDYNGLPVFYLIYAVFLFLLTSGTYLWSQILMMLNDDVEIVPTVEFFEVLGTLLILLTNTATISYALLIKRKKIVKFNSDLEDLEKEFNKQFQEQLRYNEKSLIIQITIAAVGISSIYIYDWTLRNEMRKADVISVAFALLSYLQVINIFVVVLQIHFYSFRIKHMVECLHKNMLEEIRPLLDVSDGKSTANVMNNMCTETISYIQKYDKLCDIVDDINDTYQYQIFLIIACAIIHIINGLNLLLKMSLNVQQNTFGLSLLISIFLNMVRHIVSMNIF